MKRTRINPAVGLRDLPPGEYGHNKADRERPPGPTLFTVQHPIRPKPTAGPRKAESRDDKKDPSSKPSERLGLDSTGRGIVAGLDFVDGRATTSSLQDAANLMRLGFSIEPEEAAAAARALIEEEDRVKAVKDEERRVLDEFERSPAGAEALRRKHRAGRKRRYPYR